MINRTCRLSLEVQCQVPWHCLPTCTWLVFLETVPLTHSHMLLSTAGPRPLRRLLPLRLCLIIPDKAISHLLGALLLMDNYHHILKQSPVLLILLLTTSFLHLLSDHSTSILHYRHLYHLALSPHLVILVTPVHLALVLCLWRHKESILQLMQLKQICLDRQIRGWCLLGLKNSQDPTAKTGRLQDNHSHPTNHNCHHLRGMRLQQRVQPCPASWHSWTGLLLHLTQNWTAVQVLCEWKVPKIFQAIRLDLVEKICALSDSWTGYSQPSLFIRPLYDLKSSHVFVSCLLRSWVKTNLRAHGMAFLFLGHGGESILHGRSVFQGLKGSSFLLIQSISHVCIIIGRVFDCFVCVITMFSFGQFVQCVRGHDSPVLLFRFTMVMMIRLDRRPNIMTNYMVINTTTWQIHACT